MTEEQSKADHTRERILTSALLEFVFQGYSKASTNRIMEHSGMAKGLLFHYFKNKQQLYLACLRRVLAEFQISIEHFLVNMPSDLFERIEALLRLKQEFFQNNPIEFQFMLGVPHLPADIAKEAQDIMVDWRRANGKLLADYDQDSWVPEVNQAEALELIVFVLDGLDRKWVKESKSSIQLQGAEILAHAKRLLELLKRGFYQ